MRLRAATLLAGLALAATACAGGPRPHLLAQSVAPDGGAVVGQLAPSAPSTTTAAADLPVSAPLRARSAAAPVDGPDGTATDDEVSAAGTTLRTYLDALAAGDHRTAMASSTGGPWMLAFVRQLVASANAARGGATTGRAGGGFQTREATHQAVRFTGTVSLDGTVASRDDAAASTATVSEALVRRAGDRWSVAELAYQDQPVLWLPHGGYDTIGDLLARLVGGVVFGHTTGTVVELSSAGGGEVHVSRARLTYPDGSVADATTQIVAGVGPALLYSAFPRRDDLAPRSWTAVISMAGTERAVELRF